jgi:hypothetical protein
MLEESDLNCSGVEVEAVREVGHRTEGWWWKGAWGGSPSPDYINFLTEADSNTVKCHYCSGNTLAPCDSFSVMNCTGNQTVCVTLNGTWSRSKAPPSQVNIEVHLHVCS